MRKFSLLYYRGRVALYAILKAIGIGSGDEVLTQAFTCVAVPEGIMATGAKPGWVDIEPEGYNMSVNDLELKITEKTRAIIVQHTYGIPADMTSLLAVAEKHGIPVIEDCCHTLASTYKGRLVGSFGIGSFYSFEWGKPVVAGIGGAALINDERLRTVVEEQYQDYRLPPSTNQFKLQLQYLAHRVLYRPFLYWPVRWLFHTLGSLGAAESNYNPVGEGYVAEDFSFRMIPALQRRLEYKLEELNAVTAYSDYVAEQYRTGIIAKSVLHPIVHKDSVVVFARYPLRTANKRELLVKARQANVELAEWYTTPVHPLSGQELKSVYYDKGMCPNAEMRCQEVVTLPTHRAVTQRDIRRIVKFLNEVA